MIAETNNHAQFMPVHSVTAIPSRQQIPAAMLPFLVPWAFNSRRLVSNCASAGFNDSYSVQKSCSMFLTGRRFTN